ncbi:MAG: hydroxymethylbilane synthase [Candidatus Obscuribacterales bacterium]|nr:hydroxymethylbilane synthase [Candidatus Obscuribacterales bacterium]
MASKTTFVVGTRDSTLALIQTDMILKALSQCFPDYNFQTYQVKTIGDKVLNKPLAQLGSTGVFVKELEEALLANSVDFVIHSLKDLPTTIPPGLRLAATLYRDDPRDVLVSRDHVPFLSLPPGSRVATSSRRRAAQLSALRRDLTFVDIRGNIPTRLRKHDEGSCDAMVLAAAGLLRLGLTERITEFFDPQLSTPAAGQGALGIECRDDDQDTNALLSAINDTNVWTAITAERAFLNKLGGGCSVPVGAHAELNSDGLLELTGCVASMDGKQTYKKTVTAEPAQAANLGETLAAELVALGAGKIISDLLTVPASVSPP